MSDFRFGEVEMLHALWLVPALAALMLRAARRRRRALEKFVESGLLARLGRSSMPDPARRVLKCLLVLAAIGSLVVALARPAWDAVREEVTHRGRDVVFLLDVSRSMLAEDLPPNRIERAKLAILDAVDRLDGDRVALAVFAGATVVKCPLTLDYGFFRMALGDVTTASVSRGGTLIGDGLRTVLRDVFDGKRSNFRDIVLITDGEDHESFPVEAAAEAGALGVRLIAIGLGDERTGQRVPVEAPGDAGRTFLTHEGREVWSRLDADALRGMADATPDGVYLNVSTGSVDLGEVYLRLIASSAGREVGTRELERLEEKFQIFLAACILLLALETALRERRRSAPRVAVWLLAASAAPPAASAASVRGLVNEGNEAFRTEAYGEALKSYEEALEQDPDSPHASLNRANALYRTGRFAEAADGYSQAVRRSLERGLRQLEATGLHNLGNALYRQAEAAAPTDPRAAMDLLVPAARSYLDALRADARRADSAHNLELTRRFIHALREQANQQGGGRDRSDDAPSDDDSSSSEAMEQAASEQRELADESEQLERDRREQRDSASREAQRQRAHDLADRQEDLRERTEQLAENAGPEARQQLDQAGRHQDRARQELERARPGEAESSQRQAAEAMERAAQSAAGGEEESVNAQAGEGQSPQGGRAGESPLDPEATADRILAKEQQDRRRRQRAQQVGRVPVKKDW
ncbi:MAG: VWA domain-containing protein [Bryobacterales bacterium]|nr:VWA domain-containing protein [Bryobacterales bacterium]